MMKVKTLKACLIFLAAIGFSGCASTHFVKTCPDFEQKMNNVKNIGLLAPISYGSNRESSETALENAVMCMMQGSGPYKIKLISKRNYPSQWDSNIEKAAQNSYNLVRQMELEGLWKDKKTKILSRKFTEDIKTFKILDPDLDSLLLVKCEQHYGTPAAAALYALGALGGILASVCAEKDPVIGSHAPADNDTYASAVLVDLATADVIWYNFSLRYGLDVEKDKHAKEMAREILYGIAKAEK